MRKSIMPGFVLTYVLIVGVLVGLLGCKAQAENVKIVRDEYGIPHIYAATEEGLLFGQGYVMAEDRLFQLEMCRQSAQGKLAAMYGEDYLEFDKFQRRELFTDKEIQKYFLSLPEKQKKLYLAFASGINAFIKEAIDLPDRKLSYEFHKSGIRPEAWNGEDVIRVFLNSFLSFFDCTQELENAAFYKFAIDKYGEVEGKGVFNDVIWIDDPEAPVTAPSWKAQKKKASIAQEDLSFKIESIAARYKRDRRKALETLRKLGVPCKAGSYALAISGKKTSSGNPMLLAGPQVDFGAPSYLYETGLHGEELDCYGFTYVGIPGLITGQNSDMCWAVTVGRDNQVDYFIEKLNPGNDKQYWYKGKWMDMEKETFIIGVKGKKDEMYDVYKTAHGPVIAWDLSDPKNPVAYTKRWSYKEDCLESWNSSFALLKARNSDEFYSATRTVSFSLNYLSVDRKGDINFMHSGKYPIRDQDADTRLPADGSGKGDWLGYVDSSELPQMKNPQEGYFVSWNNKPAAAWNNGEQGFLWGALERANLFNPTLNRRGSENLSFQDIKELEKDITTTNIYAPAIKPVLLGALSTHQDPGIIEARRLLTSWNDRNEDNNGDGNYDSPGLLIFETWWEILLKEIFFDDLDKYYKLAWNEQGASLVLRVLQGSKELHHDFLNGRDPNTVMAKSLELAIGELKEKYGEDQSRWLKKVTMIDFRPILPGSNLTAWMGDKIEIPYVNRGSGVLIVEASKNWIKGVDVLPPGESGFISKDRVVSEHTGDQLKLYTGRKYKDMLFYPEDVEHHIESVKIREFK